MSEKELSCPSCGPGTKTHAGEDGKIICENCGGTFVFETGEAKLKDVGQLERLRQDVEDLKAQVKAGREVPTEDPDREMPDRDPNERVVVEGDEEEDDEDL
jgi:uncharacterized Zn finger protein (UPF0148 family)